MAVHNHHLLFHTYLAQLQADPSNDETAASIAQGLRHWMPFRDTSSLQVCIDSFVSPVPDFLECHHVPPTSVCSRAAWPASGSIGSQCWRQSGKFAELASRSKPPAGARRWVQPWCQTDRQGPEPGVVVYLADTGADPRDSQAQGERVEDTHELSVRRSANARLVVRGLRGTYWRGWSGSWGASDIAYLLLALAVWLAAIGCE